MPKILEEISVNITDRKALNKLVSYVARNSESYMLFDGLSNNEILEQTFGEKVYQFLYISADINLIKTSEDFYEVYATPYNGDRFFIGNINSKSNISDYINSDNINFQLYPEGGKYKRVVANEMGQESVKQFSDPLKLTLRIVDLGDAYKEDVSEVEDNHIRHQPEKGTLVHFYLGCLIGFCLFLIFLLLSILK